MITNEIQLNKIHKSIIFSIKENVFCFLFRKIEEFQAQLEFERLKREKLESELDECRREIARLINTLRALEDNKLHSRVGFESHEGKKIIFDLSFSIDHLVILVN